MWRLRKDSQGTTDTVPDKSHADQWGKQRKEAKDKRPKVITVDKSGQERKWGPLSRATAWRVGSFWDGMKGQVDVFLEKDGKRKKVQVELRIEGGKKRFWFVEKAPEPPQRRLDEKDDESVTEEAGEDSATVDDPVAERRAAGMSEDDKEEVETGRKMWVTDKITTLEKEKEEMSKTIQELRAKIELQEKKISEMSQRNGMIEGAIADIVEHVKRQISFNDGVKASFTSLAEVVNKHQNNFTEVVRIFKIHEQRIAQNGAASQEMARCINTLVQDSEKKTVWISSLMRDSQEQMQVLRRHEVGLHVQAEVLKSAVNQQARQRETATRTVPTVEELDDNNETVQNFPNGPSPQTGPPNLFPFGMIERPEVPTNMEVTPVF